MEMEMSSQVSRGRGKNKRPWAPLEDQKLIEALKELVADGVYVAENGFKDGYIFELEKMMEKKLPSCGLRAKPHILSRVKTLKGKCTAIMEMVNNKSGFNWDDERKMIVCEKSVCDDWAKSHRDAKRLYNTPFPYFDDLEAIFCKDRANGKRSEDVEESIAAMEGKGKETAIELDNDLEQDNSEDEQTSATSNKRSSSTTSSAKKKKVPTATLR